MAPGLRALRAALRVYVVGVAVMLAQLLRRLRGDFRPPGERRGVARGHAGSRGVTRGRGGRGGRGETVAAAEPEVRGPRPRGKQRGPEVRLRGRGVTGNSAGAAGKPRETGAAAALGPAPDRKSPLRHFRRRRGVGGRGADAPAEPGSGVSAAPRRLPVRAGSAVPASAGAAR